MVKYYCLVHRNSTSHLTSAWVEVLAWQLHMPCRHSNLMIRQSDYTQDYIFTCGATFKGVQWLVGEHISGGFMNSTISISFLIKRIEKFNWYSHFTETLMNNVKQRRETWLILEYRSFSHDVTAAMIGVPIQRNNSNIGVPAQPLGIQLYFYANTFFCFIEPIWPLITWVKTIYCWTSWQLISWLVGSSTSASDSNNNSFWTMIHKIQIHCYKFSMKSIDNVCNWANKDVNSVFTKKLNIHLFSCFDFRLDVHSWITPITNLVINAKLYNIKLICYSSCHYQWKAPSDSCVVFMEKMILHNFQWSLCPIFQKPFLCEN